MSLSFLIVGGGFSGSVLARELASRLDCYVEIVEERDHLAGNCYTKEDPETGIMLHQYGPHIFNTDKKEIWDYFNHYSELRPYVHRVKAFHKGRIYSLPINLSTLNQFYQKLFSPSEAKDLFDKSGNVKHGDASNFEEQAISLVGLDLYKAFFYGYTKKQWGCEPRELPASVMRRLPVRFDYNDAYHLHQYSGIPVKGYTDFVEKLLDHRRIRVRINKKFHPDAAGQQHFDHIFYTGPIDAFFNFDEGRLGYRTLRFEKEVYDDSFQGCTQVNYTDEEIPFTRITEFKYFTPWKQFDRTVIMREFSQEAKNNDPLYYPKRLSADKAVLDSYIKKANQLQGFSFLGRLGTYRYLDMQHVIGEAIDFAADVARTLQEGMKVPVFPAGAIPGA